MNSYVENIILTATGAQSLGRVEVIQSLWSGYGEIIRCQLNSAESESVVVKHINLSVKGEHPRGWDTDISHQRKLRSYEIEVDWYKQWSQHCNLICRIPQCLAVEARDEEVVLVLEDLNAAGFPGRRGYASQTEMKACLLWLAEFHAIYMGTKPDKLWEQGCYWHLATRPDEWAIIKDQRLKGAASEIDVLLSSSKYQTFVHGDAKLANFCFSTNGDKASAVDFQYVGGGCGMKDVVYFLSSCLDEDECEQQEKVLLDFYFNELSRALAEHQPEINIDEVISDWRELYAVAWADFYRFLEGWSPSHWKVHSYSKRLTYEVLDDIDQARRT